MFQWLTASPLRWRWQKRQQAAALQSVLRPRRPKPGAASSAPTAAQHAAPRFRRRNI